MGNTLEVFEFYKSIFGGEFTSLVKFKDVLETPWLDQMTKDWLNKMSKEEKNWIMHIALPILDNMIFMWTDAVKSLWHKVTAWNNIYLSLNVNSKEEANKYFKALSKWWKIEMPLMDMFWWDYFWSFSDKYWVWWMISYTYPKK